MGYIVDKDGKVFVNGKEAKTWTNENGYTMVWIGGKNRYLHRIIAEDKIPNPENKPQVNHKNGIKDDNDVENLEWATAKENMNHAQEMGLWGQNILDKRKLTDEQVREIRQKYIPKEYTYQMLADEYGLSKKNIELIVKYKSYKEVE